MVGAGDPEEARTAGAGAGAHPAGRPGRRVALAAAAAAAVAGAAWLLAGGPGGGDVERVVVYTALGQTVVDALVRDFEARSGLEVEVVRLGSSEVLERARAERAAPRADVIWSVAGEQLEAGADLLEPWTPPEAAAIDPRWARPGAAWTPFSGLLVAFAVSTAVPPAERPARWTDLLDPRWRGRIVAARADTSGSAAMQLANLLDLGRGVVLPGAGPGADGPLGAGPAADAGGAADAEPGEDDAAAWARVEALLGNVRLVGGSAIVPRLVADGEADVGLTLEDLAARYVEGGAPLALVHPVDGAAAAPDGVAVVRGAPRPAAARAFVAWAVSREAQAALAAQGRRPVRSDVPPPAGLPALDAIAVQPHDLGRAAARLQARVARWAELAARREAP